MINFFRKTRKRLADDNKPMKYMRYAIGEIVLVVIGILIALQINNWNEFRKERILEKDYLTRMRLDLQKDTTFLKITIDNYKKYAESNVTYINSMYLIQKTHEDYINLTSSSAWFAEELILRDNTFSEISSSGKFGIISNVELKEAIIDYYKSYDVHTSHISEMNRTGLNMLTEVLPYLSKYFIGSGFNETMYKKKDWEFINDPNSLIFKKLESTSSHFVYKYGLSATYCENLLIKANELIALIQKEK